uniref:(northern house mosquito) hypothetical protein n=1 Tax=Culex pipiens TaxID=7175 RepID=A0A8D7ZWI5_CULPI
MGGDLFLLSMFSGCCRVYIPPIFSPFSMKWHTTPTYLSTHTERSHFRCWENFSFFIYISRSEPGNQYFPGGFSFFWVDESSQTATCHDFPVHLSRISLLLCCSFSPIFVFPVALTKPLETIWYPLPIAKINITNWNPLHSAKHAKKYHFRLFFTPGFRSTKLQLCTTLATNARMYATSTNTRKK